ncbi:hypothetical protein [Microcystis phage Mel-JY01]
MVSNQIEIKFTIPKPTRPKTVALKFSPSWYDARTRNSECFTCGKYKYTPDVLKIMHEYVKEMFLSETKYMIGISEYATFRMSDNFVKAIRTDPEYMDIDIKSRYLRELTVTDIVARNIFYIKDGGYILAHFMIEARATHVEYRTNNGYYKIPIPIELHRQSVYVDFKLNGITVVDHCGTLINSLNVGAW